MAELDPQAAALLETVEAMGEPPTHALSVESARERLRGLFADASREEVDRVEDVSIGGPAGAIPVRLYAPAGEGHPLVVYLHGGGWTVGDLETYDPLCRALSNATGCAVLSVEYRLAPEHPFPAAVEDAYAAVEWATEFGGRINCDPERVAVAGDSAGGNLSAAVTLLARDRGGPALEHQALLYPAVAAPEIHEFESHEENAEGYLLEAESARWYYEKYLPDPLDRRNEYAAPLLARDLSGLPPATVVTAGFDPLRDEGEAYAVRLREAGVPVEHHSYGGMIHGFVSFLDQFDAAHDALGTVARELRRAFDLPEDRADEG